MTITISKEMADVLKEVVRVNMAIVHDELLYEESGIDKIPGVKEARAKIATLEREIQVLGEAHRMLSEPDAIESLIVEKTADIASLNRVAEMIPPPAPSPPLSKRTKKRRMGRTTPTNKLVAPAPVQARSYPTISSSKLAILNAALDDRVEKAEKLGKNDGLRDILLGQADAIRKEIEEIEKAMPAAETTNGAVAQTLHVQQTAAAESQK